jgi:regulator of sirC expression with transglutaminase-like and TPR domain
MDLSLLPDEIVAALLSSLEVRDVGHVGQSNVRLRHVAQDESLWNTMYTRRWRRPALLQAPKVGWHADYARRHKLDAAAMRDLEALTQPSQRETAWKSLLSSGLEIEDCVRHAACSESPVRAEAKKVLVGLNQSETLRKWKQLLAAARPNQQRSGSLAGPKVEDGALLLVQYYLSSEQLMSGGETSINYVRDELDALGRRLAERLHMPVEPVAAVRALSTLLFHEERYCGNEQNYYDYHNSMLDHVLLSRTGIPISLSVLFAAVCARVGVQLDMIGLPGHFLLATTPQPPNGERVFIDVFHSGRLLTIDHCEMIVRAYGIEWSEQMATPVPMTEVWGRMVRNLMNCHKQTADIDRLRLAEQLLLAGKPQAGQVPYPAGTGGEAGLMHLLQSLLQLPQE